MSRQLNGSQARLMGAFYVAVGVLMVGAYFFEDAAGLTLALVVAVLAANLIAYFTARRAD
jgi:CDP-diglyceride synthetase